jgi:microcystin-dependent protein
MAEPFVGEIKMFAGNFAPQGFAFCDGQLLTVSQNDALFSLLGTIYGGDGRTTFGLPDLRGRVPVHQGTGPGLSQRRLGSRGGEERHTLVAGEVPAHTHTQRANPVDGNELSPAGGVPAKSKAGLAAYIESPSPAAAMHPDAIGLAGGGQPHENMMPWLGIHYIIALVGIYPSRS